MTDRELMQQALEVLEYPGPSWFEARKPVVEAIRARLAQPEPEPVAWLGISETWGLPKMMVSEYKKDGYKPVYLALPQRKWQGLTYKDRCELWNIASKFSPESVIMHDFAKDIEALLKAKNEN